MSTKPVALTFADFSRMCSQAEALRQPLPCYVQFRKRGEVLCGLVLDAAPGQGGPTVDFFQLRSEVGVSWCAHHNVRACSGVDGRCSCEAGADTDQAERRGCAGFAPPHGNTGVAL